MDGEGLEERPLAVLGAEYLHLDVAVLLHGLPVGGVDEDGLPTDDPLSLAGSEACHVVVGLFLDGKVQGSDVARYGDTGVVGIEGREPVFPGKVRGYGGCLRTGGQKDGEEGKEEFKVFHSR